MQRTHCPRVLFTKGWKSIHRRATKKLATSFQFPAPLESSLSQVLWTALLAKPIHRIRWKLPGDSNEKFSDKKPIQPRKTNYSPGRNGRADPPARSIRIFPSSNDFQDDFYAFPQSHCNHIPHIVTTGAFSRRAVANKTHQVRAIKTNSVMASHQLGPNSHLTINYQPAPVR